MQNEENKSIVQKLAKGSKLSSFYGTKAFDVAVSASNFDIFEEIDTIVNLIRDPDPKIALPALKHFRSVLKDIGQTNGLIGNIQQSISCDNNGQIREQKITSTQKLLTELQEEKGRKESDFGGRNKEYLPPSS